MQAGKVPGGLSTDALRLFRLARAGCLTVSPTDLLEMPAIVRDDFEQLANGLLYRMSKAK